MLKALNPKIKVQMMSKLSLVGMFLGEAINKNGQ